MAMQLSDYTEIQQLAKPGDVVAFGGSSALSGIIKLLVGSSVSHNGVILDGASSENGDPMLVEATVETEADSFTVRKIQLADLVDRYPGHMWLLPRSTTLPFELDPFKEFLEGAIGTLFDAGGGAGAVLGELVDRLLGREVAILPEDLSSYFCSELVAQALEEAETVPDINASEVSPTDLCKWAIYTPDYHAIDRNDETIPEIPGYNTLDPSAWSNEFLLPTPEGVLEFQQELQAQFAATQRRLPTWKYENEHLREGLEQAVRMVQGAGMLDEAREIQTFLR